MSVPLPAATLARVSTCDVLPDWMSALGCDARFNTYVFILFFLPVVLLGYWAVPSRKWKLGWITAASFLFYGFWDVRFVALIVAAAAVDYFVAIELDRHDRHRKLWLLISILFNLGILAVFKYTLFAADSANSLFAFFGTDYRFPRPDIILPLGISFFTFKTMSYTIDVYRRQVPVCREPMKYLAFVALFPELVLGPIVRFSTLSEQLDALPSRLPWNSFATGLVCFSIGLFKKAVIADYLSTHIKPLWLAADGLPMGDAWAAALGFAVQIYFDFSAYSDMAMGLGAMLGLRFPINFRAPYHAVNPSDLWRRWHISLTTWIRDYVYIPLGGNRVPRNRFYFNLMASLVLAGLWHGAGWTYVVFGAAEGVIMITYHANRDRWATMPILVQRLLTFLLWVTALVIFRAPTLKAAGQVYAGLVGAHGFGLASSPFFVAALLVLMVFCMVAKPLADWTFRLRPSQIAWASFCLAAGLLFMARYNDTFFYYQF